MECSTTAGGNPNLLSTRSHRTWLFCFRRVALFALATFLASCSDSNSPATDQTQHEFLQRNLLRTSTETCEVVSESLTLARHEFRQQCGQAPRDCDPLGNTWRCSSQIIGHAGPPSKILQCRSSGRTLSLAKANYASSCNLPRRDCDRVGSRWLCSSDKIGFNAPNQSAPPSLISFLEGLSVAEQWNELGLAGVRSGLARPTVTTHQMFILSAAMYDALAVYHPTATPYALSAQYRQPSAVHTAENKREALSHAAYQTLIKLFPRYEADTGHFRQHLRTLGYNTGKGSTGSASYIGHVASRAVFAARRNDGSNSENDYEEILSDYFPESYVPKNSPGAINQLNEHEAGFDPNRWQPLRVPTGLAVDGLHNPIVDELNINSFGDQEFLTPHWGAVDPFALASGNEFRPSPPPQLYSDAPYIDALGNESSNHEAYLRQVNQVLEESASLDDRKKIIAEFWADGPRTESPPGHWNQLAHGLILRDNLDMDQATRLFFALNGALLDAGIATWEAKRYYDFIRPASAIRFLFAGEIISAWGGPNVGTQPILGENWSPYQSLTFVTPPFPEYVSGHSTFSRAAAEVLMHFTGSDQFYDGVTVTAQDVNNDGLPDLLGEHIAPAGSFFIEPGPASDIILQWPTLRSAADEAGISRLFGGIHIQDGDLRGRALGEKVGVKAYNEALQYFNGTK
ncbi:MAG: vanadium-dependent haloperoxidase [Gammaproteobacteria bacterium]|nr:vanadium-dependent haloperoxidase [Gammaproteobacteria bacterium]